MFLEKIDRYISLNFWMIGFAYWFALQLFAGCALSPPNKDNYPSEKRFDSQSRLNYIKYIQDNQKNINLAYSKAYGNCDYIIDSDPGIILIQNLINPELVHPIINEVITKNQLKTEKAILCFNYIISHFKYFPMPETWPTIVQTLKTRKGDCKGFSLLLLSILISIDVECYIAISNSHMWVEAKLDGVWKTFETDSNPDRNLLYKAWGFYENPMFKIYFNRSEKRIRAKGGNMELME